MSEYSREYYKKIKQDPIRWKKHIATITRCQRKNKNRIKQQISVRIQRNRDYISNYLLNRGCEHCGESNQLYLTFHHIDPKLKKAMISYLVQKARPIKKLEEELKKCMILCYNCHNKLHWKEKESTKQKRLEHILKMDAKRRCSRLSKIRKRDWLINHKETHPCSHCGESHPGCLVLHHIDPKQKKFALSERGKSWDLIKAEIKKCIVLCFNCHVKLHNEEGTAYPVRKQI